MLVSPMTIQQHPDNPIMGELNRSCHRANEDGHGSYPSQSCLLPKPYPNSAPARKTAAVSFTLALTESHYRPVPVAKASSFTLTRREKSALSGNGHAPRLSPVRLRGLIYHGRARRRRYRNGIKARQHQLSPGLQPA